MGGTPIIRTPDQLSAEWIGQALGRSGVELVSTERIGTGQMSQSHRVVFTADGEHEGEAESVVIKLASDNPDSRGTGVGMGAYYREIAFYRNLADRLGGPLPQCYMAEYEPGEGWFSLVLEDIEGATQGDQIAGCGPEEARIALRELARLQAPIMNDLALATADYLNQPNPLTGDVLKALLPAFLERHGDRIAPEHAEVCERFVPSADAWGADRRDPLGLVHGDFRLDNLLFRGDECKVVDWQTVTWGPALIDAAYFVGGGLSTGDRRAHEEALVREYHEQLREGGVGDLSWERCWEEYRRGTFHGIVMTVAASMVVERTDRGDDMFMAWLERNAQQILDLEALDLLPDPDASKPPPLRPEPEDDAGRHSPGPEPLWNESWYFDVVSDDGRLGVYHRIGRLPNQDCCVLSTVVCGPDRPSVILFDAEAPLPAADDEAQTIDANGTHAVQRCEEPLQRFRVQVRGTGQSFEDGSAPLRGEPGEPVELEIDLSWETDGVPYQWRQTTRYEIPCRVSGTVRVGDEEIEVSGPGQRDHSWGSRDWWATGWMWSGLHLDDGTHTHAVGIPQMPGFGVGYVQRQGELTEIETVTATEEVAANELIEAARIESGPEELALDVEPLAFGALRLEAPDGRVTFFPRAMCRVRAGDGREGTGWVEWNRPQESA